MFFETFAISDRVYIIHDGKVLKHGSPEDLINDKQAQRLYLGDKFDDMGDAFQRLRSQIAEKSHSSPTPRIGRTTRIIRLEEAEHRRKISKEYFDQEQKNRPNLAKTVPPKSGSAIASQQAKTDVHFQQETGEQYKATEQTVKRTAASKPAPQESPAKQETPINKPKPPLE